MTTDEYHRTARALARETEMNRASAARIEQSLLRAMASRDSDIVRWRRWLATAAAILLMAAAAAFVWQSSRSAVIPETTVTPSDSKVNDSVPPVRENATEHTAVETKPASTTDHPRPHRKKTTQQATVITPAGFVELPWTAGLPAFESGEIVRLDLPAASLPAYGIDISAGANRPVEADLLIGQDGLARAIRLVANSARSVQ